MKNIIFILLILPFCLAGCRKDPLKKTDKDETAETYEGYIIQGKMKGVVVTDGGQEQPFLLMLKSDKKATLVNVAGETTLSYSIAENRIVLDDNGYFNLKDGQITDWLIAGFNFTKASLLKVPEANILNGKTFGGSIFSVKIGAAFYSEVKFDASFNQLSYPRNDDGKVYDYNAYANIAGFRHSNEYNTDDFFMLYEGKLEVAGYSTFNGLSVGSMDVL